MAIINYKFADGHTEEIEVSEVFKQEYEKIDREFRLNKKRAKQQASRHLVSLDCLTEKGIDIEDANSPDPLEILITKEQNKLSLIEFADFLTVRQKQIVKLYYEDRNTKTQIADKLGIDESTVRDCIKRATKKILKNFQPKRKNTPENIVPSVVISEGQKNWLRNGGNHDSE